MLIFCSLIGNGDDNIFSLGKTIYSSAGNKPKIINIQLPKIENKKGFKVVLCINAFFEVAGGTGWSHQWSLKLNSKAICRKNSSGEIRLLNRPDIAKTTLGEQAFWRKNNQHECLIGFFTDKKNKLDKRIISSRDQGTKFCLDISDLVSSKNINELEIINHLTDSVYHDGIKRILIISDIKVKYFDAKRGKKLSADLSEIIIPNKFQESSNLALCSFSGKIPDARTTVMMWTSPSHLCFVAKCFEPNMRSIKTSFTMPEEHDNSIWTDDNFDLTIAPFGQDASFYKIIVNTSGITYDAFGKNRNWESNGKFQVKKYQNHWEIQGQIPFESLGVSPQNGDIWSIGCGRYRSFNNEYSALKPSRDGFAEAMRKVRFSGLAPVSLEALKSKGRICFKIKNKKQYYKADVIFATENKRKQLIISHKKPNCFIRGLKNASHIELKITDEQNRIVYKNKFLIPSATNSTFQVWRPKHPGFSMLSNSSDRQSKKFLSWSATDLDPSTMRPIAESHAIPYDIIKTAYKLAQNNGVLVVNSIVANRMSRLLKKTNLYTAVSPTISLIQHNGTKDKRGKTFWCDPVAQKAWLTAWKKLLEKREEFNIYAVDYGDERAFHDADVGIQCFMENNKFLLELNEKIKTNYGGGKFGIPKSFTDRTPGRWMAYYSFISDIHTSLMKKAFMMKQEIEPDLLFLSDDPPDGSAIYDYSQWQDIVDGAKSQLYPLSDPESCEFAFETQKINDLAKPPILFACPHIENYAGIYSPRESLALLSQVIMGGANGFMYFPIDTNGKRGNKYYLSSDFIGAPERAQTFLNAVKETRRINIPPADCALFLSLDTGRSAYRRRPAKELAAYNVLGPSANLYLTIININTNFFDKNIRAIWVVDAKYERDSSWNKLMHFVKKGGLLIITDPNAFERNPFDMPRNTEKFFGIKKQTTNSWQPKNCIFKGGKYAVLSKAQRIKPLSNTRICARFDDGTTAITFHPYGKGGVYFFAWDIFEKKSSKFQVNSLIKNFAKALNLKTNCKRWNFAFPDTMIASKNKEVSKCLTGNSVFWRKFLPDTSANLNINGSYCYSRRPDIIPDFNTSNIPFDKGKLTNRKRAYESNYRTYVPADWVVEFVTSDAMAITFDLQNTEQLSKIKLFYRGILPSISLEYSLDGKKWLRKQFSGVDSGTAELAQYTMQLPEPVNMRYCKIIFLKGRDAKLRLAEIELWN